MDFKLIRISKTAIRIANETDYNFEPVYNMGVDFGRAIDVETDGRYYRFDDENEKKLHWISV